MHLVDHAAAPASRPRILGGELEAQVHPLGPDVEQQVPGRGRAPGAGPRSGSRNGAAQAGPGRRSQPLQIVRISRAIPQIAPQRRLVEQLLDGFEGSAISSGDVNGDVSHSDRRRAPIGVEEQSMTLSNDPSASLRGACGRFQAPPGHLVECQRVGAR